MTLHNRHAGGRATTGSPMHYPTAIVFCLGWWLLAATSCTTCASSVNDVVAAEMKEHHIRGVSLAIIENGQISKAQGYGFTDKSRAIPVTTSTLFQAGSVSKPVAAQSSVQNRQLMPAEMYACPPSFNRAWRPPSLIVASPIGMNCAPR